VKKRYHFLKPLGEGSYGSVFLCEPINHIKDHKALKRLGSKAKPALNLPHPAPKVKRSSVVQAKLIIEDS
jgi:serine/threonine protein kinase